MINNINFLAKKLIEFTKNFPKTAVGIDIIEKIFENGSEKLKLCLLSKFPLNDFVEPLEWCIRAIECLKDQILEFYSDHQSDLCLDFY